MSWDIVGLNERLLASMRAEEYAGYDPFDSLNSRVLQATPFYNSEWVRLAWLQLGKRSPINLRPLLKVPRLRNPKGIGLVIAGMLQDYARTADDRLLSEARMLADWLLAQRSPGPDWQHACWGYHFDWQARAFFVPKGKPNIITTCYVARALHALGHALGDAPLIETALDAARFISRYLYTEADGRCFFAYIPGERALVHNASLWGAAWCGTAGCELGDDVMVAQALHVAQQSVDEQADDGSWVYGRRHHHQFIDGFHTGYNLEALHMLRASTGTLAFDIAIARGYDYYVHTFFTETGIAKYYSNAVYPIDMHSVSQAVITLLKVGGKASDRALCDKVIQRAIELMYQPGTGQFIYQKTRWLTNRINYSRWTQAWAYLALAYYNRIISASNDASH
jgi:hypothetical protein